ncbi:MAG: GtrA family protein [Oscillospiraceae bacterium]|nr:GtrA family protein [Oscillospiraceae bacterium]
MKNKLTELVKAAKFALVGVANTLIDYGVFALLAQVLGVNVYLSQVVGYSCGILNSYIFNRSWTFRSQSRFFSPTLVRFLVLNLSMLALSTGLLALFLQFGLSKLVAKACTVVVTMAVGFVVNRLWVFRADNATKDA